LRCLLLSAERRPFFASFYLALLQFPGPAGKPITCALQALLHPVQRALNVVVDDHQGSDEQQQDQRDERPSRAQHMLQPAGQAHTDHAAPVGHVRLQAMAKPSDDGCHDERAEPKQHRQQRQVHRLLPSKGDVAPGREQAQEEQRAVPDELRYERLRQQRPEVAACVLDLAPTARAERRPDRRVSQQGIIGRVVGDDGQRHQQRQPHHQQAQNFFTALVGDKTSAVRCLFAFFASSHGLQSTTIRGAIQPQAV